VLCLVIFVDLDFFFKLPMTSTFFSPRSIPSRRVLVCSSTRYIATSVRVMARGAGTATKKYAELKKKKKLNPEAEMRLQVQKAEKQYKKNAYKLTLEDVIHVVNPISPPRNRQQEIDDVACFYLYAVLRSHRKSPVSHR